MPDTQRPILRDVRFEPVGDRCVLIRVSDGIDPDISRLVHALTALIASKKPRGAIEIVPAFNTIAVHFDPMVYRPDDGLASAQLIRELENVLRFELPEVGRAERLIDVPACYGGEFGPDLEDVARRCNLSIDEAIALHSATPMTLYAFFFAPGNPFVGPLDARLRVGRRASPRTRVEAGSVAIANGMSSIYAATSPGGWNVIARTPWNLFDVHANPPTRLRLGDRVRFRPISLDEYRAQQEARR